MWITHSALRHGSAGSPTVLRDLIRVKSIKLSFYDTIFLYI